MYARQITSEEAYALSGAKHIVHVEQAQKRETLFYKAKQKLIGIFAISASITVPLLLEGNVTISLFTLPLGLYLFFTKERII